MCAHGAGKIRCSRTRPAPHAPPVRRTSIPDPAEGVRRVIPAQPIRSMMRSVLTALVCGAFLSGCGDSEPEGGAVTVPQAETSPRDTFWDAMLTLCGDAHPGTMVQGSEADSSFANNALVMHVRQCSDDEIRIPFHVGEDRSRTWILTRTADGLRLKHDHRHEDGSEDEITQYGGNTRDEGTAISQEFHADDFTAALVPGAETNIWTVEVRPGETFAYALRREGTDRRVRVEFNLAETVPTPPTPWGHPEL